MVMVYRMPTKEKIERFWQWFEQNQQILLEMLKTGAQQANQKVNNRLKSLNRLVVAHLSMSELDGKADFILSADGIEAIFPIVEEIMRYAPNLEKWTFSSFIPPQQVDLNQLIIPPSVRVKDLKFKLTRIDPKKYVLDVYVPELDQDKFYQVLSRVFDIVRQMLGEYKTVKFIEKININPLDETQGLLPISQLPAELGQNG